jgi:hypothetical protein
MKYFSLILAIVIVLLAGCEPLSFPETSNERDVVGDVLALVTPDTVQKNTSFTVKLSFPKICGGTFKNLIVTYDTTGKVTLQPIIHQVPGEVCPAVYEVQTVTTSLKFSQNGTYQIIVIGNVGSFKKTIRVVNEIPTKGLYSFRFQFQNRRGDLHSFQSSSLRFISPSPDTMFSITAKSSGIWDSTFASSAGTIQYTINGFLFQATKGITEEGIIIIP